MKKKEDFIIRNIADEYIMIPVGKTALKFNGTIMINEISAFIWDHIEEVSNEKEMSKLICKYYEENYNEVYNDIKVIFRQMKDMQWIE